MNFCYEVRFKGFALQHINSFLFLTYLLFSIELLLEPSKILDFLPHVQVFSPTANRTCSFPVVFNLAYIQCIMWSARETMLQEKRPHIIQVDIIRVLNSESKGSQGVSAVYNYHWALR